MSETGRVPVALSIAGSDSGGGAGIQADLKAFAACGVHGTTAITALTAQSTVGVEMATATSREMIVAQVRAVAEDIGVDAVKVGMLADEPTIDAVVEALGLVGDAPVVVDPVMVAESGAVLLEEDAVGALVERVLPLATVATPNLDEAAALAGLKRGTAPERLARAVRELGPDVVVVTGGHDAEHVDTFFDGERVERIGGESHPSGASHGSGCTHSSALAARLALGDDPLAAARHARALAGAAVGRGLLSIGAGTGPVDALGVAAGAGWREPAPLRRGGGGE